MNPAEMIVLIILIVTIGRVLSSRKRGGAIDAVVDKLEPGGASAADAERMRAEIHRLNDRLAVLERIATDPAKRLSDEIDSLKHK
jgi:hypothetical protein